jgi:predicted dehydrogenase
LKRVGVGIIGCGNVSSQYLSAVKYFPILDVRAIADIDPAKAKARSAEFGIPPVSINDVLKDQDIEIIINLTVPKAHAEVSLQAVRAGKHVHSEKPLATSVEEAMQLQAAAAEKGLRIGCAPDTFLGGSQQTCRKLVDDGAIGRVIAGTAFFMCPGHEKWHPDPGFFYLRGGGPVFDMAPYYITSLVNLLGPVRRVAAITSRARDERVVQTGPLKDRKIPVEVATHASGTLEFVSGAIVTIVMSFDIAHHGHRYIELYGTSGSLSVPNPDEFGGPIEIANDDTGWKSVPTERPFAVGNYRILGAAEMAHAIRSNRPHRANGDLALHVLEVIQALQTSSDRAMHIEITSRPDRPRAMPSKPWD